jgi:hypothetical protein
MLNLFKKIIVKEQEIEYNDTANKSMSPSNEDIDFIIETIQNSKMDVTYIEQINLYMSQAERLYLIGQMDKLEKSIKILNAIKQKGL